jgi:23S rRNA pseudouridine1911/1915/1917 synthase
MTGQRLDRYLSERHPDISRARWQEWIAAGQVRVNGQPVTKPAHRLRAGDMVDYTLPPDRPPDYDLTPEALPVPIVYEDDHLLVVNKPRGLTVHPAPWTPTRHAGQRAAGAQPRPRAGQRGVPPRRRASAGQGHHRAAGGR